MRGACVVLLVAASCQRAGHESEPDKQPEPVKPPAPATGRVIVHPCTDATELTGELSGGWGYGHVDLGPGGGTGLGTIGTGRYGTIGHGSGSGYGGLRAPKMVRIGEAETTGDLDKNIIRRYVRQKILQIDYCYERRLVAKPNLAAGTVTAQFTINGNGVVTAASASGLRDGEVETCVAGVIKSIQFPKPKGGGEVRVTSYPFTFRKPETPPASQPVRLAEPDSALDVYLEQTLPAELAKDGGVLATCQARALKQDPLAAAQTRLQLAVGADGQVTPQVAPDGCVKDGLAAAKVARPPAAVQALCDAEMVPPAQPLAETAGTAVLAAGEPIKDDAFAGIHRVVIKTADDAPAAAVLAATQAAEAHGVTDVRMAHGKPGAYTVVPAMLRDRFASIAVEMTLGSSGGTLYRGRGIQDVGHDPARLRTALGDAEFRKSPGGAKIHVGAATTAGELAAFLDALSAAGWPTVVLATD